MSSVKQRYRDISPVTLQVVGGAVSSSLYCGEVEGLSGGLVESFLVELYRCKLCQFTCGLKASISSHLLLRHRPPTLAYHGSEDREEAGLQLDLNAESKQSDEDEDFLLYNMLDNMSPPTCDISSEGGLQVAHTCEVSTLFEEESSIFPLKGGSVDLSIEPPSTQEEMAQSAHLMTLGLCRISAAKPPPPPAPAPAPAPAPPPPEPGSLKRSEVRTSPCGKRRLMCLLCPLALPSRRMLDVHVRSHRTAGGFSCVCCGWTADSWEELEPHWRSHCRRKRRRKRREDQEEEEEVRLFSCPVCLRTFRSAASRNLHQQKHKGCDQRRHSNHTDGWKSRLIGRTGGKDCTDR
ncbi:Krueppel-like factor 13 [Morone saxatilis]|uniref:Krueppel-like factor 13 n=1 Tax=Morone saxatilis TaxID=34816 RepID=UPI0015E2232F|nr:Krueppel-like factor 13 [Morone saxatilis]